jgi:tetratricopeptide (TPR) repeat protein
MRGAALAIACLALARLPANPGRASSEQLAALPLKAGSEASAAVELYAMGDFGSAKPALKALLDKGVKDPAAIHYFTRILILEGETAQALLMAKVAVKAEPKSAQQRLLLAEAITARIRDVGILEMASLSGELKASLEEAVRLDPGLTSALVYLGFYHSFAPGIMGGSKDEARRIAGRLSTLGMASQAESLLAMIESQDGKHDAAEKRLKDAIKARPGDPSAPIAYAQWLVSRKRPKEGFAVMKEALGRFPNDAQVIHSYGRLALDHWEDPVEAVDALRRCMALPWKHGEQPRAETAMILGDILKERGRIREAREAYEAGLASLPGHKKLLERLRALPK